MERKIILPAVIIALILGGGAFYAGAKYGQAKSVSASSVPGAFYGMRRGGMGMRGGAGVVAGEVLSLDDKSITLKLPDGGSRIIFVSASTTILKSAAGSLSDLSAGSSVFVQGTPNSDGSISAQSVQLRSPGK